jgi:hypothetical protein
MVWIVEQERLLIVEHGLCFEGDAVFAEILASLSGIPIENAAPPCPSVWTSYVRRKGLIGVGITPEFSCKGII